MKVVLDTNVLISAFLTDGVCARILRRARNREFTFVLCRPVLEEFQRILRGKFLFDEGDVSFFTAIVSEATGEISQPEKPFTGICCDTDDEAILVCAADADYLVTGDNDLLILESYGKAKIIRPRAFELLFSD